MKKILTVRLKEVPSCGVELDLDFQADWVAGAAILARAQNELLLRLKNELHEKVALLSFDDVEFKTIKQ